MSDLIKTIEVAIGASIAVIVCWIIIKVLVTTSFFDYIREIALNLGSLLGWNFASLFFTTILAILVIMFWRWIVSWTSSNWWQNPNNNS